MGAIFDIKRFAIHDGPGIRTTVFLKGCPLSCWWCHNPESWSIKPQKTKKKVKLKGNIFEEDEIIGKEVKVSEVIARLIRERIVMEESDGGVTFSGGEPLMQPVFLKELLKASKDEGFHTAVDTSGYAGQKHFKEILHFTDLFLFDLKLMDDTLHKKYTGVSNLKILENLKFLDAEGKIIRVRIPVIKGINNTEKNLKESIAFLKDLKNIEQVDLLPYHHIGRGKYERFGLKYRMPDQEEMDSEEMETIEKLFYDAGFKVKIGG